MHTVVETDAYLADAKAAGLDEEDRARIVDFMANNPAAGDLVRGTSGVRKVRIGRAGGGKSSGYRLLTVYFDDDNPVYLMVVFAKNEKTNISKAEAKALEKAVDLIKTDIRAKRKARK
jgi:hypothetical protein